MTSRLPATETESTEAGGDTTVVLLHGFGGDRHQWQAITDRLAVPTIAYDLPGHGDAFAWPDSASMPAARDAVIADLRDRDLERIHLVGHSRGGALAALVAMKAPALVATLTLIAPGGFGPEVAAAELETFATARTEPEIRAALGPLYAPVRPGRRAIAAVLDTRTDKTLAALAPIAATIAPGGQQGTLDLTRLNPARPTAIIWGTEDAVLPAAQAGNIGDWAHVHLIEGAGHMLHVTHPLTIADEISAQIART